MKTLMYDDISHLTDATASAGIGPVPLPYSSAVRNISSLVDDGYRRQIAGANLNHYTLKDVEDMPPGPDGEPQYKMLGLGKPNGGTGTMDLATEIWQQQILKLPFLRDGSTAVILFDVLGQPEKHVRFDVDPVKATWNSIMPFRWTKSEEVPEYFRELVKLDMPIGNPKKSFQGIELNNELRSNLIYLAKNKVIIPLVEGGTGGAYTFREALEVILTGPGRADFNEDNPLLAQKQSTLKRLEERYFEKAMDTLIKITPDVGEEDIEGKPIAPDPTLGQVVDERGKIKEIEKYIRRKSDR